MQGFYESVRDLQHRNIEIFPSFSIPPHFHAQVEILCVTDGFITVTVNGNTERVTAGGICVSGSYDVHSYSADEGKATAILIPLDYLTRFFAFTKDTAITRHVIYNQNIFCAVQSLINTYAVHNEEFGTNTLLDEGWANTVLGLLYDSLKFERMEVGGRVDTVREILSYIHAHYDEELTLEKLSKNFGYSPYHFSRLFNSFTNVNLKKYVNSVRLENAADKMKNGDSITDAALTCGFNNIRSFYRVFTDYYGETPQRYARVHFAGNAKSRDK